MIPWILLLLSQDLKVEDMKQKLLCITPVEHIAGLKEKMAQHFRLEYVPKMTTTEMSQHTDANVIFTNPNSSTVFLGFNALHDFSQVETIVTASTGTVHIDMDYCGQRNIRVISITTEYEVLRQISSTAEHALCLTLAGLRNLKSAVDSVDLGQWDYLPFVGRQINCLTVGVLGFGRLGEMYARYVSAMGARVLVCDPWQDLKIRQASYEAVDIQQLFKLSDVISIHIHAKGNEKLIDSTLLGVAKSSLLMINTSRGEIIDDDDLIEYLRGDDSAKYYCDVLSSEYNGTSEHALFAESKVNPNILITPHIGGMTSDAQEIAYHHAFDLLTAR